MALRGHVFSKQLFSSACCALIVNTFLNKHSGIIQGFEISNTNSSISIGEGYLLLDGRPLEEEGGTIIEIEAGSYAGIYCKLVCEIDLSKDNTTTHLNQASYRIVEDDNDYPYLIEDDTTEGGLVHQFELAKFRRTINGIEDFVDTRSFLNFNSIYDEIEREIKNVKDGSIYVLKEDLANSINTQAVYLDGELAIWSDKFEREHPEEIPGNASPILTVPTSNVSNNAQLLSSESISIKASNIDKITEENIQESKQKETEEDKNNEQQDAPEYAAEEVEEKDVGATEEITKKEDNIEEITEEGVFENGDIEGM